MAITRTFTVYNLVAIVNGEEKIKTFSRQSQAEQHAELLAFYGVETEIVPEKRAVEL